MFVVLFPPGSSSATWVRCLLNIVYIILSTSDVQPLHMHGRRARTYSHTCTHSPRADNNNNLQMYCVEGRSPVAFRVEGTPAWSLYNRFSCLGAAQSKCTWDWIGMYVVHWQGLFSFIYFCAEASKVLMKPFSDLLFSSLWSSLRIHLHHFL